MSDPDDDAQLLTRWRDGDQSAGHTLLDRHYATLARFFVNKTSDPVEDLVQQVMLACVEGRERITDADRFVGYLFGTARNVLRRHYEQRRTGRARVVDFAVVSAHDLLPSPSAVMARGQNEKLLLEGLRRIPLEHQIVLELHYWEGMSSAQIGTALQMSASTVRARLSRGRQLLEVRMGQLAGSPALLRSTIEDLERWAGRIRQQLPTGDSR